MANPINIEYLVNGTDQVSPLNWDVIGLTADLSSDFVELELTESTLVFEGDDKTILTNILNNVGLEAAIPLTIRVRSENTTVSDLLEEFVLTVKDSLEIADTLIRFGVQKRYGATRFMDRANKTTWDVINLSNAITGAVNFPYREIDPTPNDKIAMMAIQGGTSLIALYDSVTGLASAIAAAVGGITGIAESIIQIALEVVRAILLGIVIAKTAKEIFRTFFPEQKYFWENKVRSLIRQGCEYLGYTLSSTLLDSYANMGIIGVPLLEDNKTLLENLIDDVSYFNGKYPSGQDTVPTFGALFTAIQQLLNAKIMVIGQTLHFESESFYQQNPVVTIKESLTDQEQLENLKRYNLDESWYHKFYTYQTDISDRYTLDKMEGVAAEYKTDYTGTAASDLVDIQGSETITFPFCHARRKEKLSYMDEQAIIFGAVIDTITSVFGSGTNLVQLVKSSVGQMIISSQHFTTTKITWAVGGKQTPNYLSIIGAKAIANANHANDRVKENFQELKDMTVQFSVQNFRDIINGRFALNQNNDLLKIKSYSWMPSDAQIQISTGRYVPELSKTQTLLING